MIIVLKQNKYILKKNLNKMIIKNLQKIDLKILNL